MAGEQDRIQQIACGEADLPADPLRQLITIALDTEVALTKICWLASKGVFAIQRVLRTLHRKRTDIQGVDLELVCSKAGIEQCHGNRIRLFAGRTRQTQDTQRASAADFRQALPGQAPQGGKGFGVTEEPGLGHDHRFDQGLLFILGTEQALPVAIVISHAQCNAALAYGTFDNRRADRCHIQADALLQIVKKTLI